MKKLTKVQRSILEEMAKPWTYIELGNFVSSRPWLHDRGPGGRSSKVRITTLCALIDAEYIRDLNTWPGDHNYQITTAGRDALMEVQ